MSETETKENPSAVTNDNEETAKDSFAPKEGTMRKVNQKRKLQRQEKRAAFLQAKEVDPAAAIKDRNFGYHNQQENVNVDWKTPPVHRQSHQDFFESRDWSAVANFWGEMMTENNVPSFIAGDEQYGFSDLKGVSECGAIEYMSTDPRFKRQTFAIRVGYNGTVYNGYQKQNIPGVDLPTVQADLEAALGRSVIAAGRTDKDVSAMSQVVCFSTYDEVNVEQMLTQANHHEAVIAGRLAVWECFRVPKRFHALFSATWRRYVFLFPLNIVKKVSEDASSVVTTTTTATISVESSSELDGTATNTTSAIVTDRLDGNVAKISNDEIVPSSVDLGSEKPFAADAYPKKIVIIQGFGEHNVDVDAVFVQQCFERIQGSELPFNGYTFRDAMNSGDGKSDLCTLLKTAVQVVDLNAHKAVGDASVTPNLALSVELVGDRFLRRMVRILVATAIRESVLDPAVRDVEILHKICLSGARHRASFAIDGKGLSLCGVGYDLQEMQTYRHNPMPSKKSDYGCFAEE